uniref:Uncharacterized protein n=1 Tax=Phyllymenia taiwanensis TaxID=1260292 RepID=R9XWE5_9FLOR|nr:hypothetical protein [Grateloupia taiwanensis]AGO19802.1 hypothetical protein [Grateloupia taiwanensis]
MFTELIKYFMLLEWFIICCTKGIYITFDLIAYFCF